MVEKSPGEAGPALTVQTDGIHFPAAWEATDVVDWAQARQGCLHAGLPLLARLQDWMSDWSSSRDKSGWSQGCGVGSPGRPHSR